MLLVLLKKECAKEDQKRRVEIFPGNKLLQGWIHAKTTPYHPVICECSL